MAGLFGLFGGPGEKAAKPIYSIEHLQHLFNRLQQFKENDEQNRDAMVEVIRQTTECLLWGEKHDPNLFDFFCEKNMLAHFVHVVNRPLVPKTVKVQLLQTLSMLIQNIRRDTSLYYLFSNNYVNQLISTRLDWNDEEILGYYISFLKSLALRLNAETVKFFFNERAQQFPLYIEAVRFFGHHDVMVRAAVRTLTLQVYGIQDTAMRTFLLERSSKTYFVHLACYLRDLWYRLDALSRAASVSGVEHGVPQALTEVYEELTDLLMYLSDVLDLGVPEYGEALAVLLLNRAVFPVLLGSLLVVPKPASGPAFPAAPGDAGVAAAAGTGATASGGVERLAPACALFVLRQVLETFRSPALLEPLVSALLCPTLTAEVQALCLAPPPPPPDTYPKTTFLMQSSVGWAPADSGGSRSSGGKSPISLEASGSVEAIMPAVEEQPPEEATASEAVSVRGRLLAYLGASGSLDVCALLVAGVLRLCLERREVLPEDAGLLLPSSPRRLGVARAALAAAAEDCSKEGLDGPELAEELEGHPLEVLLRTVCALERHTSLRVVVIQGLARLALDLAAEVQSELRAVAIEPVRRAAAAAARQAQSHLQGALGDGFLDVFAEEWEQHRGLPGNLQEACSSVRCILPPATAGAGASGPSATPMEWTLPAAHSERQHAAKAIRCLLTIQWLHGALVRGEGSAQLTDGPAGVREAIAAGAAATATESSATAKPAEPSEELGSQASPLHIHGEVSDDYQEGRSFQLGRQDRIVCGVVTPEGRHTRYLVLHKFLLLLVQPDLVSPGWAAVRTVAPVKQVESQIDHNDARLLRLTGRLPRGAPCPGEASQCDPSALPPGGDQGVRLSPEEHRSGSFFMLSLSFEDVKRCHCADQHVRKQRQEVRAQLRKRVEAYIDGICS